MISGFFHFLGEQAFSLQQKTFEHISLAGLSVIFASAIAIPLGILITRFSWLQNITLRMGSISQTIPSLGLLALLIPFVGLGTVPTLIVLTFYAIYPILKNTNTGLRGVPSACIEAANGLGFSSFQRLRFVELPLALPSIISGIRIATAMTVGITTIAAFIGAGGLGDFITQGLALNNPSLILLGTIPAAVLAFVLDYGISRLEKQLQNRELKKTFFPQVQKVLLISIVSILIVLIGSPYVKQILPKKEDHIVIASKNFTEQYLLAELMAQLIEAKSPLKVIRKTNLGSIDVIHQALLKGEVDLYPEYTGTAYLSILKFPLNHGIFPGIDEVRRIYESKFNLLWLKPFGFSNGQTLAVKKEFSQKHNVHSLSDLAKLSSALTIATPPEFLMRQDAFPGLKRAYGFTFRKIIQIDPSLLYSAIDAHKVDVISVNTTDAKLEKSNLVSLEDDKKLYPLYQAAPIIRKAVLKAHPQIYQALSPLFGLLTQERIARLNYKIDVEGKSPFDVAHEFLCEFNLL